jgi:hypothetical protein
MIENICKCCGPNGTANNRPVHLLEVGVANSPGAHMRMSTVAHFEGNVGIFKRAACRVLRSTLDSSARIAESIMKKVKDQTRDTSGEIPLLAG